MEDLHTIQAGGMITAKVVNKTLVGHDADNMRESHKWRKSEKETDLLQRTQNMVANMLVQDEEMIILTPNEVRVTANPLEGQVGIEVGARVLRENGEGVEVEVGMWMTAENDDVIMKETTGIAVIAEETTKTESIEGGMMTKTVGH
jgi:hypothetical protein